MSSGSARAQPPGAAALITGTGLYRPPHVITNAELVASFNAYADIQNAKHAAAIAAGERQPVPHSSVEFIEKASGIKQRYVIEKEGVLDVSKVFDSLQRRDRKDSTRKTAPLQIALGAKVIDSTSLQVEDVVAHIVAQIRASGLLS